MGPRGGMVFNIYKPGSRAAERPGGLVFAAWASWRRGAVTRLPILKLGRRGAEAPRRVGLCFRCCCWRVWRRDAESRLSSSPGSVFSSSRQGCCARRACCERGQAAGLLRE
jgi:hypothetical protein